MRNISSLQGTIADLSNSVHSTQEAMSTLEADKNHQLDRCSTEAKKISEELVNAKATLDSVQTELAKEEQRSAVKFAHSYTCMHVIYKR